MTDSQLDTGTQASVTPDAWDGVCENDVSLPSVSIADTQSAERFRKKIL